MGLQQLSILLSLNNNFNTEDSRISKQPVLWQQKQKQKMTNSQGMFQSNMKVSVVINININP